MKNIFIVIVVLISISFAQNRFNYGAFYNDISMTNTNTMVLIGTLPQGSCLVGIRVGQSTLSTNIIHTNSIQVGISTRTNFFLATTQLPMPVTGGILIPTTLSNAFITQTAPRLVYGYVTRAGALDAAGASNLGVYRVSVIYIQK